MLDDQERSLTTLAEQTGLQSGAQCFDRRRRSRNQLRYETRSVGEADADVASRAARALYEGATARDVGR